MLLRYKVGGNRVKLNKNYVDLSLALTNKVEIAKVGGIKHYGFICLQCRKWRQGNPQKNGVLKCETCGYKLEL